MFSLYIYILVICLFLIKVYVKLTTGIYEGKERLDGKTIIVTGASAGIGADSAKDFARRGARVVMVCRDIIKGKRVRDEIIATTGNQNLVIKHADFESLASVRKCANEILAEEARIDVLLNNVGIGVAKGGIHVKTQDGLNRMMQTNYFSPFLFTNVLLKRIKESSPSRIVNVSSIGHHLSFLNLNDLQLTKVFLELVGYYNSKMANIYFNNFLAKKLKGTGVTANSLHPGTVKTEIYRHMNIPMKIFFHGFLFPFFKNSWEGAQTSIMLCVSSSLTDTTGKYFSDCKEISTSKAALDFDKARVLWDLTEKIVNLQDSERHY